MNYFTVTGDDFTAYCLVVGWSATWAYSARLRDGNGKPAEAMKNTGGPFV